MRGERGSWKEGGEAKEGGNREVGGRGGGREREGRERGRKLGEREEGRVTFKPADRITLMSAGALSPNFTSTISPGTSWLTDKGYFFPPRSTIVSCTKGCGHTQLCEPTEVIGSFF